jgi:hypothetical protein
MSSNVEPTGLLLIGVVVTFVKVKQVTLSGDEVHKKSKKKAGGWFQL